MNDKLLAEWFWVDRWVGSSAFGLSIEARGLYREMLSQAWRRGASLPNDHDQIRRLTGVTIQEWKRVWPKVERYWIVNGDTITNETQVEVYREAQRRMRVYVERAQAGAQARWKQSPSNAQASAQAQPEESVSNALRSPISDLRSESATHSPRARERLSLVPDAETERAGWLVNRYGELYSEHRKGARHRSRPNLDWSDACTMVPLWSNARLEKLAVLVLTTDDPWISNTDRSFKIFALKASWADDRLKQWEAEHGVTVAV